MDDDEYNRFSDRLGRLESQAAALETAPLYNLLLRIVGPTLPIQRVLFGGLRRAVSAAADAAVWLEHRVEAMVDDVDVTSRNYRRRIRPH